MTGFRVSREMVEGGVICVCYLSIVSTSNHQEGGQCYGLLVLMTVDQRQWSPVSFSLPTLQHSPTVCVRRRNTSLSRELEYLVKVKTESKASSTMRYLGIKLDATFAIVTQ